MTLTLIAVTVPPLVTVAAALLWSAVVARGLVEGHEGGARGGRDIRTW